MTTFKIKAVIQVQATCSNYTISDSYGHVWQGVTCSYSLYDDGSVTAPGPGSYVPPTIGQGGSPQSPNIRDSDNDGKLDCWKSTAAGDHNLDSSDSWGTRTHPITGNINHHNGIDIQGSLGTVIRSVANGTITEVVRSTNSTSGNGAFVRMEYTIGNQLHEAVYLHMNNNSATVSVNDTVMAGQVIGGMNSTGGSTGNHLHLTIYEVSSNGNKNDIDPVIHLGGSQCTAL